MAQEFNVANVNTKFTTSGLSTVQSGINKLGLSVGKVAGLLGGLGLAFSAKNLATSFFQTTKKLEQMKMAITAVSKTAAEADATFERIKNWAEINPVNTDDAIAAFVRMRTAGVQNAEAAMTQIADLASVTSRNMADVASAVVTTEVEPLRNLGIQLDRTGKQAIIQFGEVKKAVSKDINSVRAGIIEVLQQAIPNAMERTKNSVTGSLNTMSGMWQKMQSDIMGWGAQGGGLFGSINKSLNEFRDSWQAWMDSADYQKFINDVSGSLQKMLDLFVSGAQKIGTLTKALYEHRQELIAIASAFAAYKIGMSGIATITKLFSSQFAAWISLFPAAIKSVADFTAWIGMMGAAMTTATGVIGIVAALLGGIFYRNMKLAQKQAEETAKAFQELDKEFKNADANKLKSELASVETQLKKLQAQAIKTQISIADAMEAEQTGDYSKVDKSTNDAQLRQAEEKKLKIKRDYLKKQLEQVQQAGQAQKAVEKANTANIGKESTGKGKSATEQMIERIDAQVKYANADLGDMITQLEEQQGKLKPLSDDWGKVTDKIKELKSTQTATNELQMQLANAEPYKKATASLDFYLEEQKKAQNITDDTINSYERLQRQKTAMSNTDNALSAVISQLNDKLSDNWQNADFVTAEFEKLGKMSGLTAAQLEQVTKAQKELNDTKDSKAVSNILYGVEIGALQATDAMKQLQEIVNKTMSAEGVSISDYGKFSDQLKNQLSALGQVAMQELQPAMDMLQKQYETGVLTLPAYVAQLRQLKTAYADIPAVVTQIDSTIKQANATASTFATRMQSAIGDATKSFNELNSTALTGIADGFARAVSYGEDFGESLKKLGQDIAYTITKMMMLKAVTSMFGGLFGGTGGGGEILTLAELGGRHSGGIVGVDAPTFKRSLPLPKFHTGGIVGNDEELAILKKGEGVFTKGQMQALGNSINNKTQTQTVTEGGTQIGSMTVNINAIDQQSFASNLANNKAVIEGIIVKNVMSNGNVRRTLKTALA